MEKNNQNKMSLSTLKQTILQIATDNKDAIAISSALAAAFDFIVNRWVADAILLSITFLAIGLNIITGVMKARKNSEFDIKTLRDKTRVKMMAYMIWLFSTYLVAIAMMISIHFTKDDGEVFVKLPSIMLHYPITATYLFFILVEMLSVRKNLIELGVKIPGFSTDSLKKLIPEDNENT